MKALKKSKSILIALGLFSIVAVFSVIGNQNNLSAKPKGGETIQCGDNCYYSFTRGCVCWKK